MCANGYIYTFYCFQNFPEFKEILGQRDTVEKAIDKDAEIAFNAFRDKKLKLENVHPYVVKRYKESILKIVQSRLIEFFEEKTKDLAENDEVGEGLQEILAEKMKKFEELLKKT